MKFSLKRLRLNSQGYTDAGQYYGVGKPLWHAMCDDPDAGDLTGTPWCPHGFNYADEVFRAYDRDDAKSIVRAAYPTARFYR